MTIPNSDQAPASLSTLEQPARLFMESPTFAFTMTRRGLLTEVNRAWVTQLGHPREVSRGAPLSTFVAPQCLPPMAALQKSVVESGESGQVEISLLAHDGREVRVVMAMSWLDGAGGQGGLLLGHAMDVTSRYVVEALREQCASRARSANEIKNTFLANMGHELRTPLNSILGYAQLLMQGELEATQRRGVEVIYKSGEHLIELINSVLDMSRIELGHVELIEEDFDLNAFLENLKALVQVRLDAKQLTLVLADSPDLPRVVRGDVRKLRQVLLNLLSNAIKFTDSGVITLRVSPAITDAQLYFEVSDTGVGIPPEKLDAIFEPFQRLQTGVAGVGLGLAISSQLVRLMGGELKVESDPGVGSRFHFRCPLPESSAQAPRNSQGVGQVPLGYEGRRRRVLVADDEPENRRLMEQLLAPMGFEVQLVSDGAQAIEAVVHEAPDAVLLDLVMPVMDGFEAAHWLRSRPETRDTFIVALSASVLEDARDESIQAGCDAFLNKPIRLKTLCDTLQQGLDLTWIEATGDNEGLEQHGEESAEPASRPPSAHLAELRAAAGKGRIMHMRQALAELQERCGASHGPFLTKLNAAVRAFDTAAVLHLTS